MATQPIDDKEMQIWRKIHASAKKNNFNDFKVMMFQIPAHRRGLIADLQDGDGNTVLILFAKFGQFEAVDMLLRMGADPNLFNRSHYTAIHYAAMKDYQDIALVLVEKGGNPTMRDRDKKNAYDYLTEPDLIAKIKKIHLQLEKEHELELCQISGQQRELYRVLFDLLDEDQDGLVSIDDIHFMLRRLGLQQDVNQNNLAIIQAEEEKRAKHKAAEQGRIWKPKKKKKQEKKKKKKKKKKKGQIGIPDDGISPLELPTDQDVDKFYFWWDNDHDEFLSFNDFLRLLLEFNFRMDDALIMSELYKTPRVLACENLLEDKKRREEKFGQFVGDENDTLFEIAPDPEEVKRLADAKRKEEEEAPQAASEAAATANATESSSNTLSPAHLSRRISEVHIGGASLDAKKRASVSGSRNSEAGRAHSRRAGTPDSSRTQQARASRMGSRAGSRTGVRAGSGSRTVSRGSNRQSSR